MPALRNEIEALDRLIAPDHEGGLAYGWSAYAAHQAGVTNHPDDPFGRAHNVVENEEEITRLFAERPQPTVVCAYCRKDFRTRSLPWAKTWFRDGHECVTPFAAAEPIAA